VCDALGCFQAREGQQFADQFIHAHAFAFDAFERRGQFVGLLVRQANGGLQARQRRAQFVRDVVQQAALAVDQVAQLSGHAVEVAAKIAKFVAAPGLAGKARRQVAGRGGVESAAQGADRARKIPGQQGGEQQAGKRRADHGENAADAVAEHHRAAGRAAHSVAGAWAGHACAEGSAGRPFLPTCAGRAAASALFGAHVEARYKGEVALAVGRQQRANRAPGAGFL
jgi:hypothetical protein